MVERVIVVKHEESDGDLLPCVSSLDEEGTVATVVSSVEGMVTSAPAAASSS